MELLSVWLPTENSCSQNTKKINKNIKQQCIIMERKFPALLILVVFLSNGFYKKPQHVAILSFSQQIVSTEISPTGCSEFYTIG
jgi:hypothetical protein